MKFDIDEIIFLSLWSFFSSILGFFAFYETINKPIVFIFFKCILFISIGFFISFSVHTYIKEQYNFSIYLNIVISGISSFLIPKIILNYWKQILTYIGLFIIKIINNINNKER